MVRESYWGQVSGFLLSAFGRGRAGFQAEAVIPRFHDMTVMGKAVEHGGRHLGVAENTRPFAEAQVRGDDHGGPLVKLAQQVEEQRAARRAEWQIAEFIENHEIAP